ncbi:MAG: helix-turn-helix transcriptional regulator [Achromobacter xylosoxidans]|nr:helix-turn-helix transcriptional regulator [Achromobacter xylosoxidans]
MRDPAFDRAVEAALAVGAGQGEWLDVATTAMQFMGADQACFLCFDRHSGSVVSLDNVGHDEKVLRQYADYYYQFDDVTQQGYHMPLGSWLDARADQKRHAPSANMYWTDFMRANRITQVSAVQVGNDAKHMAAVSVYLETPRRWKAGHLTRMQFYRDTLCRAFASRQAMTEQNLKLLDEALLLDTEAYCVVSPGGRIIAASSDVGKLLRGDSALSISGMELRHRSAAWDKRLKEQLAIAAAQERSVLTVPNGWGRSYRLVCKRVGPALSLGIQGAVGVRIDRRDLFEVPSAEALRDLLALTPAEAALCHHLVAGHSLAECALLLEIAPATARKQLASIFRKTGCNRQAELTRLASGL